MADSEQSFLRSVELRLLRCTISQAPSSPKPSPSPPSNPLRPLIESLLGSIESGDYGAVLASDAALLPFPFASSWDFKNSTDSSALFYAEVERSVDSFLLSGATEAWLHVLDAKSEEKDVEFECKYALLMCLAVAAFLAFTQRNVTGPIGEFCPFPILVVKKEGAGNGGGEWDMWARRSLASVGCDVQGKFSLLQAYDQEEEHISIHCFEGSPKIQALEATTMLLDMSSNKPVDVGLLDKLMRKFEERSSTPALSSCDIHQTNVADPLSATSDESTVPESVLEGTREYNGLLDMLGNVLQQVVRSGGSGDIWDLYARWHKIKGDLAVCSEALLKQVRSLQGSDMWRDSDKFKRFAHVSFQFCKIYMEITSSTGSRRELTTAEMHLRSSVKQVTSVLISNQKDLDA